TAAPGVGPDAGSDAMRAEHHHRSVRHLIELVDEHRASLGELGHDVAVMDDLLAHVDRRTQLLQRQPHDVDGTDHAGTEAAPARHDEHVGIHAAIRADQSVVHELPETLVHSDPSVTAVAHRGQSLSVAA